MPENDLLFELDERFEFVVAAWVGLGVEEIIFKIGLGLIGGEEDLTA